MIIYLVIEIKRVLAFQHDHYVTLSHQADLKELMSLDGRLMCTLDPAHRNCL